MALTFVSDDEDQADASAYEPPAATGTAGHRKLVGIWGRRNAAGPGLPATCSIGGEALSPIAGTMVDGNVTGDATSFGARWFIGDPSVGGTQALAYTFTVDGAGGAAATMLRSGYVIYDADGLSATAFDTLIDEATANNDRVLTGAIDAADGGSIAALGVISSTAAVTCTVTGLATEDVDEGESSANNYICAAHENGLSAQSGRTITLTWSAGGASDDACLTVVSLAPAAVSLTANGIATPAPALGTPALSQAHVLAAVAIAAGAPILGAPALTQAHVFLAVGIAAGAPALGSPALSSAAPGAQAIEAAVVARLAAPLAGLIGDRLYPVEAPVGAVLPYVVYRREETEPDDTLGAESVHRVWIVFECVADTYAGAVAIAEALRGPLDNWKDDAASGLMSMTFAEESDGVFDEAERRAGVRCVESLFEALLRA